MVRGRPTHILRFLISMRRGQSCTEMLSSNAPPTRVLTHTLSHPYLLIPEKQEVGSAPGGPRPSPSAAWGFAGSGWVASPVVPGALPPAPPSRPPRPSHPLRSCRRTPCGSPHPSTGPTLSPGSPRCPQRPGRWPGWWHLQVLRRVTPRWSRPCRGCSSRGAQCPRLCVSPTPG